MATKTKKPSAILQPCLRVAHNECLQCGYPLYGLELPRPCPECGLVALAGRSYLSFSGVSKKSPGPLWRKLVWVILGIVGFLLSQSFTVIFVPGAAWIYLVIWAAVLATLAAMLMTGKKEQGGSSQFVCSSLGIARWPSGVDASFRTYTPWTGDQRGAFIRRISPTWSVLKVVCADKHAKHTTPLETGFRCPERHIDIIERVLNAMLTNTPLDSIEGLEESDFFDVHPDIENPNTDDPDPFAKYR
tara:strand:+ start:2511 stop:3245 length:735 start_codon:yes stop_codon:yes gene_type:complete